MNPEYNGPNRSSILDQWRNYSRNGSTPSAVYRTTKNSTYFVKRLSVQQEIPGHDGCVNTVHWNKPGTILLSGSDDRYLNLYSYPSFRLIDRIKSGHRANIFNAKFLPQSNDSKICSCSGDGLIHYNNLLDKKSHGKNAFKCHAGITYDVLVHNQDPNGFLSCGEDGTVRYFDLRTVSSCNCSHCNKHTLIDIKQPITSCTLNPFNPNEIVVGCDDSTIRAYDRRYRFTQESKTISQVSRPQGNIYSGIDPKQTGLIYAYRPPTNLLDESHRGSQFTNRLTCVTFNWKGDEILASYCPTLLTLFSTVPKSNPSTVESDVIRSNLFNECFLFPGGINKSDRPKKEIKSYEQKEDEFEQKRIDDLISFINEGKDKINESISVVEVPASVNTNEQDSHALISETISQDQLSLAHDNESNQQNPITNDTGNVYSSTDATIFHLNEGDTRILHEGLNQNLYQESNSSSNQIAEVEAYNLSDIQQGRTLRSRRHTSSTTVASVPSIAAATVDDRSNDPHPDNNNSSDALLTSDHIHHTHHTHHVGAAHSTSLDADGHSSRTAPLPRTRGVVSSDIYTNWSSYDQNDSEAATYSEFASANTASNQLTHQIGYAPSIESHSQPSGRQQPEIPQKRIKTSLSRFSTWDCASSGYSKTCISDDTSAGAKAPTSNQEIEMDYNPTFFNTLNSIYTATDNDRLRSYFDDLFVPSYVCNYKGHHNSRTMIKECNFYGDDFVMSGSDDGNVFIWDKWTTQLLNVFNADNNVVNCLQPHPVDPVMAVSGIDPTIKIVAPVRRTAMPLSDITTILASTEREARTSSNYYFDATPTMIFHVLLALERIQRNRADDTTPQPDPPDPEITQPINPDRLRREGFQRNTRGRNAVFANFRRTRTPTVPDSSNDDSQSHTSQQDMDLVSYFESDAYDDDGDEQEYFFEDVASTSSHSSSSEEIDE